MSQYYSSVFLDSGLSLEEAKARYLTRRLELLSRLTDPCLIVGPFLPPCSDVYFEMPFLPMYQDPYLLYLTGIIQTQVALYLNPHTKEMILYLPPKDESKLFWEGFFLGVGSEEALEEIYTVTGFNQVVSYDQLFEDMLVRLSSVTRLGLLFYEKPKGLKKAPGYLDVFKSKFSSFLKRKGKLLSLYSVASFQWESRLCLDGIDIQNLKKANQLSLDALSELESQLPFLSSETEVSGVLNGALLKRTSMGLSFPTIVASGKNACVLHYHSNHSVLDKNSLLLLDFGCRYQGMPADISRTLSLSKPNALQALLLSIVSDAQALVQSSLKAGVTIQFLNQVCWEFIEQQLEVHVLKRTGSFIRSYKKAPHNVSHLLGFAVHDGDPYRSYRTRELLPGMVISNEPGIYGFFDVTIEGKRYQEHIGIRIEDTLLVTDLGCENLTRLSGK